MALIGEDSIINLQVAENQVIDESHADSVSNNGHSKSYRQEDTVSSPSQETTWGIVLTPPEEFQPPQIRETQTGFSIVMSGLFTIFFAICFRFHNNTKFLSALKRNLFDIKERSNLFDDTVRETSFLFLLNIMWCGATGVILYYLISEIGFGAEAGISPGAGMGVCMLAAIIYTCFMFLAFLSVGSIFSDLTHSRMWVKGFAASQGIMGVLYFPLALAFICYPGAGEALLWVAGGVFIIIRILFIFKGFRIFFTQSSSWVLFLYYLCSLEVVPLILTYAIAARFCRI